MGFSKGKQLLVISTLIKIVVGLYDSSLIFTINNKTVDRNRLLIEQNSSQTLECWTNRFNKFSIYPNLKFHDKIIRGDPNTTHVSYHFPKMQCHDAGRYYCYGFSETNNIHIGDQWVDIDMNCTDVGPVEKISFKYENKSDDLISLLKVLWGITTSRDDGKYLFTANKQRYNYFKCAKEKTGRPSKLAIKYYTGTVITETSSEIINAEMNCEDSGKITCELTDILSNATYIKETYVWLSSCVPKLCHDELDRKNISARLSSNAEVSFCFMMEGMGQSVTKKNIFKDGRLLNECEKLKYLSEVTAVDDTLILNTFNFTVANVDLNDFGKYSIDLLFDNGQNISFNFVLYKAESSLLLTQNVRFLTIGVPILLISLIIALAFAICLTFKKFRLRISCFNSSSDLVVVKTEGDCVGRIKYTLVKKDQEELKL